MHFGASVHQKSALATKSGFPEENDDTREVEILKIMIFIVLIKFEKGED